MLCQKMRFSGTITPYHKMMFNKECNVVSLKHICLSIGILFVTALPSLGAKNPQVYVLCYHTFLGKPAINTDFSIQEFRQHIQTFKQSGVRFVTFQDILNNRIKGSKNVFITIDDGNISAKKAYDAVLKPAHIHPLFAIYPGIISKRKFAMTWQDIATLQKDGCHIASHGYFHEFVTERFFQSHPKAFQEEFFRSKQTLLTHHISPITCFVYPFGVTSNRAISTLKASGYQWAFTIVPKPLELPLKVSNPLLLPRFMLTRQNSKALITKIIGEK